MLFFELWVRSLIMLKCKSNSTNFLYIKNIFHLFYLFFKKYYKKIKINKKKRGSIPVPIHKPFSQSLLRRHCQIPIPVLLRSTELFLSLYLFVFYYLLNYLQALLVVLLYIFHIIFWIHGFGLSHSLTVKPWVVRRDFTAKALRSSNLYT